MSLLGIIESIINVLAVYGALRLLWDLSGVIFPNREPPLGPLPDEPVTVPQAFYDAFADGDSGGHPAIH